MYPSKLKKANFDFKKFPFDIQNLKIVLEHPISLELNEDNHYPKPFIGLFDIKPPVYTDIAEYKSNNLLKEWQIVDFNIQNKILYEKAQDAFNPDKMKIYEK